MFLHELQENHCLEEELMEEHKLLDLESSIVPIFSLIILNFVINSIFNQDWKIKQLLYRDLGMLDLMRLNSLLQINAKLLE